MGRSPPPHPPRVTSIAFQFYIWLQEVRECANSLLKAKWSVPLVRTHIIFFEGIKPVRVKEHVLLMETLTALDNIMRERLLTSPFEQEAKKEYLADVIKREKKTNAIREKLELKYNAAVKGKDVEVSIFLSIS